jgi:uncharacterized protein
LGILGLRRSRTVVGQHLFAGSTELDEGAEDQLPADSCLVRRPRAKQLIRQPGDMAPPDLSALKTRTQYSRLPSVTGLHMFVVSLRCEYSSRYCQVSRQSSDQTRYDVSPETADAALAAMFRPRLTS